MRPSIWFIVVLLAIASKFLAVNTGINPKNNKKKKKELKEHVGMIKPIDVNRLEPKFLGGNFNDAALMLDPNQKFFDILDKVTTNVKRITGNFFHFQKENIKIRTKAVKISTKTNGQFIDFLRRLKFDGEVEKDDVFKDSSTSKKENKIFITKTEKISTISGDPKLLDLTKTGHSSIEGKSEGDRKLAGGETEPSAPIEANNADANDELITSIPDYHPIKIVWDESLLHAAVLEIFPDDKDSKNQEKILTQRKNVISKVTGLIMKADSIMRRYIFIKNPPKKEEKNPSGLKSTINISKIDCPSREFFSRVPKISNGSNLTVEADLLIILDLVNRENKAIIAQAEPCTFNSQSNLATVGRVTLNYAKISSDLNEKPEKINKVKAFSQIITVLHETFHIIAFNTKLSNRFRDAKNIEKNLTYLKKLHLSKVPALVDKTFDHFSPGVLPTDLMVPEERINSSITVFSLEYIDNISGNMVTSKKFLESNFYLDAIQDYDAMLKYECKATDSRAAYPFYCTKKEMQYTPYGCDPSFIYKTSCDTKDNKEYLKNPKGMGNYCYERKVRSDGICIDPQYANTASGSIGSIEHFGEDARCFESAETKPQKQSYCLKFKIEGNDVVVFHKNDRYVCKETKKSKTANKESFILIGKSKIKVKCPDTEKFISAYQKTKCKDMCNANGTCSNGKCFCYDGFDPSTNCKEKLPNTGAGTMFIKSLIPTKGVKPKPVRMKEL